MGRTHDSNDDDDLEYHPPTREEVFAQLEDWRRRLHKLYADIISWLPEGEGYETEIRDYMTDEPPMRYVGVEPQPVPELVVRRHGESAAVFMPEACWIIGAAGRVKIFDTSRRTRPHDLVLSDRFSDEPEWRFFPHDFYALLLNASDRRSMLRGALFNQEKLTEIVNADHG